MQREEALRLVYDAIAAVNPQLPAARRLAKSAETVIVGPSGSLDSLGIVNFVITLEERVGDATGAPVQLLHALLLPAFSSAASWGATSKRRCCTWR